MSYIKTAVVSLLILLIPYQSRAMRVPASNEEPSKPTFSLRSISLKTDSFKEDTLSSDFSKNPNIAKNGYQPFENFPEELIIHVFGFFNIDTVGRVAFVSTEFKRLAEDPTLWSVKLRQIGLEQKAPFKSQCILYRNVIRLFEKCQKPISFMKEYNYRRQANQKIMAFR